ncbi:MAG: DUF2231 domain-containing protein [Phycisphaerales bacterium]
MKAPVRLLGHPVHQMMIVLPMGLLVGSIVFDVLCRVTSSSRWADVAFWTMGAGIATGLVAAVFGFADWSGIPAHTHAKRVGAVHGLGNVLVVMLFGASFAMRLHDPNVQAPTGAFILSLLGGGCAVVTGWLGGELVNRMGVGVHEGADLDAPSSLVDWPPRREYVGGYSTPGRDVRNSDDVASAGLRSTAADADGRPAFGDRQNVDPVERKSAGY